MALVFKVKFGESQKKVRCTSLDELSEAIFSAFKVDGQKFLIQEYDEDDEDYFDVDDMSVIASGSKLRIVQKPFEIPINSTDLDAPVLQSDAPASQSDAPRDLQEESDDSEEEEMLVDERGQEQSVSSSITRTHSISPAKPLSA